MNQLESMAERVRTFCAERDWDQFHGPKDLAIGLVTEASELLEIFRFQSETESQAMFANESKRTAIEDELADVLFFVLRFSQMHKIPSKNLAVTTVNTISFNSLRTGS
ncbi:MAG: nucleotide pyrophosphohydrolase [Bdellovibrionota bacterium]